MQAQQDGNCGLAKSIWDKWNKSLHELAEASGVSICYVMLAIRSKSIPEEEAEKLSEFLNSL